MQELELALNVQNSPVKGPAPGTAAPFASQPAIPGALELAEMLAGTGQFAAAEQLFTHHFSGPAGLWANPAETAAAELRLGEVQRQKVEHARAAQLGRAAELEERVETETARIAVELQECQGQVDLGQLELSRQVDEVLRLQQELAGEKESARGTEQKLQREAEERLACAQASAREAEERLQREAEERLACAQAEVEERCSAECERLRAELRRPAYARSIASHATSGSEAFDSAEEEEDLAVALLSRPARACSPLPEDGEVGTGGQQPQAPVEAAVVAGLVAELFDFVDVDGSGALERAEGAAFLAVLAGLSEELDCSWDDELLQISKAKLVECVMHNALAKGLATPYGRHIAADHGLVAGLRRELELGKTAGAKDVQVVRLRRQLAGAEAATAAIAEAAAVTAQADMDELQRLQESLRAATGGGGEEATAAAADAAAAGAEEIAEIYSQEVSRLRSSLAVASETGADLQRQLEEAFEAVEKKESDRVAAEHRLQLLRTESAAEAEVQERAHSLRLQSAEESAEFRVLEAVSGLPARSSSKESEVVTALRDQLVVAEGNVAILEAQLVNDERVCISRDLSPLLPLCLLRYPRDFRPNLPTHGVPWSFSRRRLLGETSPESGPEVLWPSRRLGLEWHAGGVLRQPVRMCCQRSLTALPSSCSVCASIEHPVGTTMCECAAALCMLCLPSAQRAVVAITDGGQAEEGYVQCSSCTHGSLAGRGWSDDDDDGSVSQVSSSCTALVWACLAAERWRVNHRADRPVRPVQVTVEAVEAMDAMGPASRERSDGGWGSGSEHGSGAWSDDWSSTNSDEDFDTVELAVRNASRSADLLVLALLAVL